MTRATAVIEREKYKTRIQTGGHALTADEPASRGGGDAGPAPYDLLLASLGACTAMTLRMYADRKQWPIARLEVDLRVVQGGEGVGIERSLAIDGLEEEQRTRLAEIAERTPVTLTLKSGIKIHTTLA